MNNKKLFRNLCSALVACSLLFTACKKESTAFKESSNPDENRKNIMIYAKEINEYTIEDMQTYTEESQLLIFQTLTPENKERIIKERIDFAIDLETDQTNINMLNTVKGMIDESLFSTGGNPTLRETLLNYTETMIPVLGYEKVMFISRTWGGSGTTQTTGLSTDCRCSYASSYCLPGASCVTYTCGQKEGCGTWWQYTCDGTCQWNS